MRKPVLVILFIILPAYLCLAQEVTALKSRKISKQSFDVGVSMKYNFPQIFEKRSQKLFLYDETGTWYSLYLRQNVVGLGIPINYKLGNFLFSEDIGLKCVSYRPMTKARSTGVATETINYPNNFQNGVLASDWISLTFAAGYSFVQLGYSLDLFLASHKIDNDSYQFVSLGNNSFSKVVPSFFLRFDLPLGIFRADFSIGIQPRKYLDGVGMYRTTLMKQNAYKTGDTFYMNLTITYLIFTSYGKYNIFK